MCGTAVSSVRARLSTVSRVGRRILQHNNILVTYALVRNAGSAAYEVTDADAFYHVFFRIPQLVLHCTTVSINKYNIVHCTQGVSDLFDQIQ